MTFDIALAFARGRPGDLIDIPADSYGPVQLHSRGGGAPGAPITLRFAPGAKVDGLKGLGLHDVAIEGGEFTGMGAFRNGLQFSQSGEDFSATCARIAVRNAYVHDCAEDGVKASQVDGVFVANNRIARCGQQCIDLLDALGFAVTGNDCSGAGVAAAISVKGGSRPPPLGQAVITLNTIHDQKGKTVAAIEVGGFGDLAPDGAMLHTRPSLAHGPAAYGVSVFKNTTRDIEGPSLVICGAESCSASANSFARAGLAPWEIGCQPDNRGVPARRFTAHSNASARFGWDNKLQNPANDQLVFVAA